MAAVGGCSRAIELHNHPPGFSGSRLCFFSYARSPQNRRGGLRWLHYRWLKDRQANLVKCGCCAVLVFAFALSFAGVYFVAPKFLPRRRSSGLIGL